MKVCILGTGLASYTLAKALVNQNIYVDIIDEKKINLPDNSRTIGISKSNIEFLNSLVINLNKISWKLKKIEIFTDNLKNEQLINFENNGSELFSIVKNKNFFKIIEKSLFKNKFFKRINTPKYSNILNNYNLCINTDYTNPITKRYFSQKIIKKYNSIAYTTVFRHEKIQNEVAVQIFTKKGPLAFLPISERETSVVYSLHNKDYKKNENIIELIERYNYKYKIQKINIPKSFELKSFHLRSYYHNNLLAFGDLLHRVHPLAGQGFNMTIRDIKVLTDLIKNKISLGLPLDSSVNREFEKISRHSNFIFSSGIDFIHEFFNLERKSRNAALSRFVQLLGRNSLINKTFTKIADKGITF